MLRKTKPVSWIGIDASVPRTDSSSPRFHLLVKLSLFSHRNHFNELTLSCQAPTFWRKSGAKVQQFSYPPKNFHTFFKKNPLFSTFLPSPPPCNRLHTPKTHPQKRFFEGRMKGESRSGLAGLKEGEVHLAIDAMLEELRQCREVVIAGVLHNDERGGFYHGTLENELR